MKTFFNVSGIILGIVFIAVILAAFLGGCGGVTVKSHHHFMAPMTWEATDGDVSVSYYNGQCCCIADRVLDTLAARSNRGEFAWSRMADVSFREFMLSTTCAELRSRDQFGQ